MTPVGRVLWGPLWSASRALPLMLSATLCDLRPRFIEKHRVGRGHRAIARNGRVLLASDCSLAELTGRVARVRLQIWHQAILGGETPKPYGLLLAIRCQECTAEPAYRTRLVSECQEPFDLALDVGGGMALEFVSKS